MLEMLQRPLEVGCSHTQGKVGAAQTPQPCATTTEPTHLEPVLHNRRRPCAATKSGPCTATKSGPCSLQLEKAHR